MSHEFETSVAWTGGKRGRVFASGLPGLGVASPPEFGGPGGSWTPEHMFVASAGSCVLFTFLAMARVSKLTVRDVTVSAKGTLDKVEHGFAFTQIDVSLRVEVESGSAVELAERLARKVEANCLVSKSMKTPIRIETGITAGPAEAETWKQG